MWEFSTVDYRRVAITRASTGPQSPASFSYFRAAVRFIIASITASETFAILSTTRCSVLRSNSVISELLILKRCGLCRGRSSNLQERKKGCQENPLAKRAERADGHVQITAVQNQGIQLTAQPPPLNAFWFSAEKLAFLSSAEALDLFFSAAIHSDRRSGRLAVQKITGFPFRVAFAGCHLVPAWHLPGPRGSMNIGAVRVSARETRHEFLILEFVARGFNTTTRRESRPRPREND